MAQYDGEILRLVGSFNRWSLDEPHLDFTAVTPGDDCTGVASPNFLPPGAFVPTIRPPDFAADSKRFRFVGKLTTGFFAFQLVSSTRGYSFRVFPLETYSHQPLRLVCGDPSAVPAGVGESDDGEDLEFHISENPGSVVSIYVELMSGAALKSGPKDGKRGPGGTRHGIAVWYVLDINPYHVSAALPLYNETNCMPRNSLKAGPRKDKITAFTSLEGLPPLDMIPDARSLRPRLAAELIGQAIAISKATFDKNAMPIDLSPQKRVALLATPARDCVIGYCLASLSNSRSMELDQLAISEEYRGRQLGRLFLREILRFAVCFGSRMVELWSTVDARGFYERFGFVEVLDVDPVPEMEQFWGPLVRMRVDAWACAKDTALNYKIPSDAVVDEFVTSVGTVAGTNSAVCRMVRMDKGTVAKMARHQFYLLSTELTASTIYVGCIPGSFKVIQDFGEMARVYSLDMALPRGALVRWTMFSGMILEDDHTSIVIHARLENEDGEAAGEGTGSVQLHNYWCTVHQRVEHEPGTVKVTTFTQGKFFRDIDGSMRVLIDKRQNVQLLLHHIKSALTGIAATPAVKNESWIPTPEERQLGC